ncbi:hypothetical protein LIER_27568 [Lithospermum erythrorhizon]|uniref:Uncharacterized protein n=1 Tax=Lithospermum erythrorhizon TaxID=34254 RepID=A0AAV3RDQ1_LITER
MTDIQHSGLHKEHQIQGSCFYAQVNVGHPPRCTYKPLLCQTISSNDAYHKEREECQIYNVEEKNQTGKHCVLITGVGRLNGMSYFEIRNINGIQFGKKVYANINRDVSHSFPSVIASLMAVETLPAHTNSKTAADLESLGLSSKSKSPDFQQMSQSSSDNISEISRGPLNIVILGPWTNSIYYTEESWTSSPGNSVDRGSIEDFLEEVKERLKHELQGNPYNKSIVRGGGIETPYSERPSDARQARETLELMPRNLIRSLSAPVSANSFGKASSGGPAYAYGRSYSEKA